MKKPQRFVRCLAVGAGEVYNVNMKFKRPQRVSSYTEASLTAIMTCPSGSKVSLGGAFGLAHYHEFRTTNDIDAWWNDDCPSQDKAAVLQTVHHALSQFGPVIQRRHGDVVSVELQENGRIIFSFQIAQRDALLAPTKDSPWPPVQLDSFEDLLAAKMTALIERGAPRDFIDIHEMCRAGITDIETCWRTWRQREEARGVEAPDVPSATEAVRIHLARIERVRPLEAISDSMDRARAEQLRNWFKNEFCGE